jgi:hypothetical protein
MTYQLANPQYELTEENAAKLYMFVASLFARVPSWRSYTNAAVADMAKRIQQKGAQEREKFHRWCADFEQKTGRQLPVTYEELRQYVIKGDYTIEQASDAYSLGMMFKSAVTVAKELATFACEILHASEPAFVISATGGFLPGCRLAGPARGVTPTSSCCLEQLIGSVQPLSTSILSR